MRAAGGAFVFLERAIDERADIAGHGDKAVVVDASRTRCRGSRGLDARELARRGVVDEAMRVAADDIDTARDALVVEPAKLCLIGAREIDLSRDPVFQKEPVNLGVGILDGTVDVARAVDAAGYGEDVRAGEYDVMVVLGFLADEEMRTAPVAVNPDEIPPASMPATLPLIAVWPFLTGYVLSLALRSNADAVQFSDDEKAVPTISPFLSIPDGKVFAAPTSKV